MSLSVRTDAGAPDTYVGGTGLTITGGGATETFDEIKHIQALQKSSTFLALLTDDVYGAGASTLVLVDLSGNDVGQGIAADFLAAIGGPSNVTAAARDSTDPHIIYYGRSSASVGSENPAAAEWQIYRSDDRVRPFVKEYANLDTLFDNIWDDRETINYTSEFDYASDIKTMLAWEMIHWAGIEPDLEGAKVAQATDDSGSGKHATNGTEANRPIMRKTGLAGGPAYEFEAGDWLEYSVEPDLANTMSFFFIGAPARETNAYIHGTTRGGDIPAIISRFVSKDFEFFGQVRADILVNAPAGATVICGYWNDSGDLLVRANGTEVINTTGEATNHGAFNITDFGSAIGAVADHGGFIASSAFAPVQASLANFQTFEGWASDVYAITLPP